MIKLLGCISERHRAWLPVLVAGLAVVFTAIPVLVAPLPPLLDYPNHLARLWLLQGGIHDPFLARVYAVDWHGSSTNILIDLVAVATAGIVGTGVLGPALLIAALVTPALGIVAVGRQVHGRTSWWHVGCAILSWTHVFLLGFINFQLALGLALLGAAWDERLRRVRSHWLILWRLAYAGVLLVAHPFGALFYAALTAGLAVGPDCPIGRAGWRSAAMRVLVAIGPVIVMVALFWAVGVHPTDARAGPATPTEWQSPWFVGSGGVLFNSFTGYRSGVDIAFTGALLLMGLAAWRRHGCRGHAGLLVTCAALCAGALLMPRYLLGSANLHLRLPPMFWLTLAAACCPKPARSPGPDLLALLVALALVAARAAWFGVVWHERISDLNQLQRVLALIPPGSRVLPLMQEPDEALMRRLPVGRAVGHQPTAWHLPDLAVIERHSFVPTLFASRGRHVLRVKPPFDRIAVAEGAIPTVDKLGRPLNAKDAHEFGYLACWRRFDYILVLNADVPNASGPLLATPHIVPITWDGFARLYRVR